MKREIEINPSQTAINLFLSLSAHINQDIICQRLHGVEGVCSETLYTIQALCREVIARLIHHVPIFCSAYIILADHHGLQKIYLPAPEWPSPILIYIDL